MKQTKFKEIEIGMIPEDWEEVIFSEVITINPYRELKKGIKAKYVSMADLLPFQRKINNFTIKKYKGGSKFKNNDTIMARITPCLENGKTAYVNVLNNGEIGFGSTEFIILSPKEDKIDNKFIYYLARSPEIRNIAIKSMTGTSGRQRVENEIFDSILISLPPLKEQQAIAKILSDLDDKIELNHQMNKTLEAIGQAVFKHWFIDFEFPNEEGKPYRSSGGEMVDSELGEIPKGWKIGRLGDIGKIQPGFAFKSKDYIKEGIGLIKIKNIQNSVVILNYESYLSEENYNKTDSKFYLKSGDVLIAMTGAELGKIGIIPETEKKSLLNQRVGKVDSQYNYLYYLFLNQHEIQSMLKGTSSASSAQGNISNSDIENIEIVLPSKEIIKKFSKIIKPIFDKIIENLGKNIKLSEIKDTLLPKLMSGQIRRGYYDKRKNKTQI